MEFYIEDYFPVLMFVALAFLLFSGLPVAIVLGGIGLAFGGLGVIYGVFSPIEYFNIISRVYGGIVESLVLVAVPMFIFMGTMLEKSGVAKDLLNALQVLLRRVPGGLALSVTLMGTVMAATTGIIGASVVMMTLMALPVMMERNYSVPLATGTIAASGTLGILIPPSIMLVIMSDLLSVPVGTVFIAAIMPGLLLAALYTVYIFVLCRIKPHLAPPMPDDIGPESRAEFWKMIFRSFLPPIALIVAVLGSIFAGFATPTEASGVGAAGSVVLAWFNRRLTWETFMDVCKRSALTGAMLFGIFVGATAFSYVFKAIGGEDLIIEFIRNSSVGPWSILFVLMAMVYSMSGVTMRSTLLSVALALLTLYAFIRDLPPDEFNQYFFVSVATTFASLGIASLLRKAIHRQIEQHRGPAIGEAPRMPPSAGAAPPAATIAPAAPAPAAVTPPHSAPAGPAAASVRYRVAAAGLAVRQTPQGWVLTDGRKATGVPPGLERRVAWMLERGSFGLDELCAAFPEDGRAGLDRLVSDLARMRVLAAG